MMDRSDHLLYLKRVVVMLFQRAESVQLTHNDTSGKTHTPYPRSDRLRGRVFYKGKGMLIIRPF